MPCPVRALWAVIFDSPADGYRGDSLIALTTLTLVPINTETTM